VPVPAELTLLILEFWVPRTLVEVAVVAQAPGISVRLVYHGHDGDGQRLAESGRADETKESQHVEDQAPVRNAVPASTSTRKLCYRRDDHAMRLIYECLESF